MFMESLIRSSRSKVDTKDIASALRKSRISIKDIVKETITECKKIPLPIKKILTDRLFYKCANNYNVAS